jgi:hypothetical protein
VGWEQSCCIDSVRCDATVRLATLLLVLVLPLLQTRQIETDVDADRRASGVLSDDAKDSGDTRSLPPPLPLLNLIENRRCLSKGGRTCGGWCCHV